MSGPWVLAGVGVGALTSLAAAVASQMHLREPSGGHLARARVLVHVAALVLSFAWMATAATALIERVPAALVDVSVGLLVALSALVVSAWSRTQAPRTGPSEAWSLAAGAAWVALGSIAWWTSRGSSHLPLPSDRVESLTLLAWAVTGAFLLVPYALAVTWLRGEGPDWASQGLSWGRAAAVPALLALMLEARAWDPGYAWSWGARPLLALATVAVVIVLLHGLVYGKKRRFLTTIGPVAALATPALLVLALLPWLVGSGASESLPTTLQVALYDIGPRTLLAWGLATVAVPALLVWVRPDVPRPRARVGLVLTLAGAAAGGVLLAWPSTFNSTPALGSLGQHPWALVALAGVTLAGLAWALALPPRPAADDGTRGLARWLVMGRMVGAGMAVLLAATALLLVLASGEWGDRGPQLFESVATAVALPFFLILGIALGNPTWGFRGTALLLGAAVATVAVLRGSTPWPWAFLLVLAAASFAALGALAKIYQSSVAPGAPAAQRLGGFVLIALGLGTLVQWLAAPDAWWLGPWLRGLPGMRLVGLASGAAVVSAGVHLLRSRSRGWVYVGCAAGTVFGSPFVGVAAGLLALRSHRRFASSSLAPDLATLRREHRKTVVYAAHLAFALGAIGHSASQWRPGASLGVEASGLALLGWAGAALLAACLLLIPFLQDPKGSSKTAPT